MRVMIIGSTAYENTKIREHQVKLEKEGHEVLIPAFDNLKDATVLDILTVNLNLMKLADEVHMIWDGRSDGTKFDFGMCFALGKPLRVIYINDKHLEDGMTEYCRKTTEWFMLDGRKAWISHLKKEDTDDGE